MKPSRARLVGALLAGLACGGCASVEENPLPPGTQLAIGAPAGAATRVSPTMPVGHPGLSPVRFALGREEFQPGDFIRIREVFASSAHPGPGDTVLVRGDYQLRSADEASLALYVTGGTARSSPSQRTTVARGTGEFELSCEIPYPGRLHISFYPSRGGSSFGGVYFSPR